MNNLNQNVVYLLGILLAINLLAFFIMFLDKKKAELGDRRISERTLFILALLFGAPGIYTGMFICRHKTKKWYFILGIPLLIAANIYLVYQGIIFLSNNQLIITW